MKVLKLAICLLITFANYGIAQQTSYFTIKDKLTKEPISYVHVAIMSSQELYLSNEDGRVGINAMLGDTLLISHLSYNSTQVIYSKALKSTIYLEPISYQMEDIVVKAKDKQAYTILKKCKQQFRKYGEVESKGYLALETFHEDKPLELMQGLYNLKSDNGNLEKMKIKSGRVALAKLDQRYFISLHTTHVMSNMQLDEVGELPITPLQVRRMEKYFDLRLISKNDSEIIIDFTPTKNQSEYFEGRIFIDATNYRLKGVKMYIEQSKRHPFRALSPNDTLKNITIELNINFLTNDSKTYISDMQMAYSFTYHYDQSDSLRLRPKQLSSKAVIYAFQPNTSFILPFYKYRDDHSDYRQISFFGYDEKLWNHSQILSLSKKQKQNLDYLTKYGKIVNFNKPDFGGNDNASPFFEDNNILWSKNERWSLRQKSWDISKVDMMPVTNIATQIMLDVTNVGDTLMKRSQSFIDVFNSNYYLPSRPKHQAYINLYFDLCEVSRRELMNKIKHMNDIEMIKSTYDQHIASLNSQLKKFTKEVDYGHNIINMKTYNDIIIEELEINNFKYFGLGISER